MASQTPRQRPLSPHLTIYKPQISSVLSILHRISGVVNFIGLLWLTWWIVGLAFAVGNPAESLTWRFFSTIYGHITLIIWSFSLFLHFCTGIRHLCWDAGWGFSIRVMHITGWLAVMMALSLTSITWFIILSIS